MQIKKRKKVLLIEPNYSNKYPPIGLMKISTYHKLLGYEVVFYKGDLKAFVVDRIAEKCLWDMQDIDDTINWKIYKELIVEFIKQRRKSIFDKIPIDQSESNILLTAKLEEWRDYYTKGIWEQRPEWDRVFVTTLFTFYWNITIDTINFAKKLVKNKKDLHVGGVLASIQSDEIERATGIKPHCGVLNIPGQLDKGDDKIIDTLPLDYSILDEIDYKYPMNNAFYGYTTRGCIRHCPFCAVPTLEPEYEAYIPLKERIDMVREQYGDQKDLLLMDNNVLASPKFKEIIEDIIASGFGKNAKFVQPDLLEISIRNLKAGVNDRAYVRKAQSLIMEYYHSLREGSDESYVAYKIIFEKYHVNKLATSTKDNLISAYSEIETSHKKHFRTIPKTRYVDFNQGVDARLFTKEKVALLSQINIKPLRIAFDDIKTYPAYLKAVTMSRDAGIKDFSNYLLYNFKDKPIDLYKRLEINVQLCEKLGVSIYSFPMKYHPLSGEYSHNRDYIGEHWNRKYIRAVQAILNSTKGKIGKGKEFFYEAFGHTEDEYWELLEMPEPFILYRFFFKWLGQIEHPASTENWKSCWNECKKKLSPEEWQLTLDIIHANDFSASVIRQVSHPLMQQLLSFYANFRTDIITPGSELYELKRQYDSNPIRQLRRKKTEN